ncbi:MAG TPA: hypothetical protein VM734_25180 [Kofleriaceae bacterium]|nr:hypothetical protein [Kofleriaceae bacterium]
MRRHLGCALLVLAACDDAGLHAGDPDGGAGPDAEVPIPGEPGPPGCGLPAAAFCDPFDAPAAGGGRARELDGTLWSGARTVPTPPAYGDVIAIGPATLPPCRVGLPATVMPDQDTLICDTIAAIRSNHLLVAAAAQNYGQSSYRIRRPFDLAGRTGTIVFDATLEPGGLLGWVALGFTAAPTAAPSYLKLQNDENAAIPRDGLEIHFNQNCQTTGQVSVSRIIVIDAYRQTFIEPAGADRHCTSFRRGALNHVEVRLSSRRVEIYASPVSDDGVTFAPVELLAAADIALPFTAGYVHLTAHNHATLKYSDDTVDAWVARFDNVGFDGPVVDGWREAEVADSLTAGLGGKQNVGYVVGDRATDGWTAPLAFSPIDLTGATRAQVTLTSFMHLALGTPADFQLHYRLNGGAPHTYRYDADQLALIAALPVSGTLPLVLDVDPAELRSGVNTIELATTAVPTSYPPAVYNLDLIVHTR